MSRPTNSARGSGRSTPYGNENSRLSRSISQLRKVQLNTGTHGNDNVLASLRATKIVASKPILPAELIATILDYLPIPSLLRCASVSRRLQEMVYDDTRWIQKLKAIGVWNEGEARQRFENARRRQVEANRARQMEQSRGLNKAVDGVPTHTAESGRPHTSSLTLFDIGAEEDRHRRSHAAHHQQSNTQRVAIAEGFEDISTSTVQPRAPAHSSADAQAALTVLDRVYSLRGYARKEFGKIYAVLGPLYHDLERTKGHSDPVVFRIYKDPEQQAQILSSLKRFSQADSSLGWWEREAKLESLVGVFESAVLREFEKGLAAWDVDGRMNRYAHVLVSLNGGAAGLDSFLSRNPVMKASQKFNNPLDCLEAVAPGHVDLNPSQRLFEHLAANLVEQAGIVDRVFPPNVDVLTPFLARICDQIISEYITLLFDEAHIRGVETYVKAVSGTFEQALRFIATLKPSQASPADFLAISKVEVLRCFEKHIDLYLTEELDVFKTKCDAEVGDWEKALSEQEASAESFFMSNISRQAAKRDFLSSFRKVIMMPVNAFPLSSPFASSKPVVNKSTADLQSADLGHTRPQTPTNNGVVAANRSSTPQPEPPTTELAAKTAIINSRLEGIKSLFSIEVALNLTHFAKASLERGVVIVQMGGKFGEEAKEQCEAIFVELLHILGTRHVKRGFDRAVEHLSNYDPRQVREYRATVYAQAEQSDHHAIGVEPLVMFLELVNVGDLIQQMIDVFYNQELLATKLIERDDFLDPAVKEKKRFEQMLDERVAAGLNKGIDVLMDEIEFLCATTQPVTDFNPRTTVDGKTVSSVVDMDIGPSNTAKQVVNMVSGHTSMLVGSTEKNMLDVFMQEVGLRLFGVLCKHIKRQRISVDGSIKLISDLNHYAAFINSLRQKSLIPYYTALRELGQIYLVYINPPTGVFGGGSGSSKDGNRTSILSTKATKTQVQAKELAAIIADTQRYHGIFPAEEVYEFAERRADWYLVKNDVERAMYGVGCTIM